MVIFCYSLFIALVVVLWYNIIGEKFMDNKILASEQQKLEQMQKIMSDRIDYLNSLIPEKEAKIQSKLDYAVTEKERLDKVEFAQIRGEIKNLDLEINDLSKDIKMLTRVMPKPFFAKISFVESEGKTETYYIGLKSLEKNQEQLIIDWRTPAASLLYFSSLGKTFFVAPAGRIDVDLLLKRQFRLSPNKIEYYVDTNTKIDDAFLQEILSQNTSSYMSNIVQTIQEEQNEIIRRDPKYSVIISGIAGSGKTSIAMHRISYILYHNRGKLKSENILVVSPNELFGKYIGELLPELGEENVTASSLMDVLVAAELTPKTFGKKISMVDSQFTDKERKKQIDKKFSVEFFDEVEDFLKNIDFSQELQDAFEKCGCNILAQTIKSLQNNHSAEIKIKLENLVYRALVTTYPKLPEKFIQKINKKVIEILKKSITTQSVFDRLYKEKGLTCGEQPFGYEDVPIYAYIESKINGVTPNYFIKHIFVDEMQDYDAFSIYLLRKIYPEASMTLAGDYNQNLMSNQTNLAMLKRILPSVKIDSLDVSYRSSYEIVKFAQKIVDGKVDSRLVRHGDEPKIIKCDNNEAFIKLVNEIVTKYPNDKIAVIAKSLTEAYNLSKLLKDFSFIKDEQDDELLTSNKILTTIYLSKGLEYDRVILTNVDNKNYSSQIDKQNLYVACTRALHGLYLTYSGELSNFLMEDTKKTNKQNYSV